MKWITFKDVNMTWSLESDEDSPCFSTFNYIELIKNKAILRIMYISWVS